MKIFFGFFAVVLYIIAIQFSCKKTKTSDELQRQKAPITFDSMFLCHRQINWDSVAIHNALIGKWQWEYIKCYWNPENANNEEFKNLFIEFKQNDSLDVKINEQLTQKSSWSLSRTNDGYFKLIVTPIVIQLPGKILFCGDRVLFYDSYVDGCDNYFKKQK